MYGRTGKEEAGFSSSQSAVVLTAYSMPKAVGMLASSLASQCAA